MRKFIITTLAVLAFAPSAFAAQEVRVKVNGMVCDFCAQAIEKVFGKEEAVSSVKVDLTEKLITVQLKDGQNMDDQRVMELVTDSGYAVAGIERAEAKNE